MLTGIATAATILFSVTGLDIGAARLFYHPGGADPWPIASEPVWLLFYRSTPWITGSLGAIGGALIVAGWARGKSGQLRMSGMFVVLSVIIGPGLIINAGLKDHWGRPRPRDIATFGGSMDYAPPLLPVRAHGKSFPCGHCSVGYLYAIGWWIWRRKHPLWAAASLGAGVTIGTLLGFGRMAAGGHFLSDIVWSGVIALGTAHVLYYYALRVPAREDAEPQAGDPQSEPRARLKPVLAGAAIVVVAAVLGSGVIASWRYQDLAAQIPLGSFPGRPDAVEIVGDTLDVVIHLTRESTERIECTGDVHGFGLPTDEIQTGWALQDQPVSTLRFRVAEKGWFLYVDGVAQIRLPADLRALTVRIRRGNISVVDESDGHLRPHLDLRTSDGWVKRP